MSNAAVINATNTSGLTAGSPFTIDAGGDVVLKAFGSGSGAWSATLAFAPYVNGAIGSPITLSISSENPSARTSTVTSSDTQWVGWVTSHAGTWEASGIVEGYQPDEAIAGYQGVFASVDALPTKAVKDGATAAIGGSAVVRQNGAWVAANQQKRVAVNPYMPGFAGAYVATAVGFGQRFLCEEPAYAFDVLWFNAHSSAATLSAAQWGVAASLTASASLVSPASLKISGSDVLNASIPSGSGSANYTVSDFLKSDPVAVDLPAGGIVEIRSNIAAGGIGYSTTSVGSFDALPDGIIDKQASCTTGGTDILTGNPAKSFAAGQIFGICCVRFYTYSGKIVVAHFGDSLAKGEVGSNGTRAPLVYAEQISGKFSPIVFARGGQTSSAYLASARLLSAKLKPAVVIVPPWSPNDTIAAWKSSFANSTLFCAELKEAGITPIMHTPLPWNYTASDLASWNALVSAVRAFCAGGGAILCEYTTALEDPANLGQMYAAYKGQDGLHPSVAGKYVMATALANAIASLA